MHILVANKPGDPRYRYGEVGDCAIVDQDGAIIGEAFRRVGETDYRPAEANARLWAVASDLPAALEQVADTVSSTGEHFCRYCNSLSSQPHRDYCVVGPAIAAAKGKVAP